MTAELATKATETDRKINEAIAPQKPGVQKPEVQSTEYRFSVDWRSPQGRRYHGDFKAHIMTAKDSLTIGVLRAGLCGGVNPTSLDLGTYEMAEMIATLKIVLDDAPDWAKDLVGIHETDLIWEVYKEVKLREDRFRGKSDQDSPGAAGD